MDYISNVEFTAEQLEKSKNYADYYVDSSIKKKELIKMITEFMSSEIMGDSPKLDFDTAEKIELIEENRRVKEEYNNNKKIIQARNEILELKNELIQSRNKIEEYLIELIQSQKEIKKLRKENKKLHIELEKYNG